MTALFNGAANLFNSRIKLFNTFNSILIIVDAFHVTNVTAYACADSVWAIIRITTLYLSYAFLRHIRSFHPHPQNRV